MIPEIIYISWGLEISGPSEKSFHNLLMIPVILLMVSTSDVCYEHRSGGVCAVGLRTLTEILRALLQTYHFKFISCSSSVLSPSPSFFPNWGYNLKIKRKWPRTVSSYIDPVYKAVKHWVTLGYSARVFSISALGSVGGSCVSHNLLFTSLWACPSSSLFVSSYCLDWRLAHFSKS